MQSPHVASLQWWEYNLTVAVAIQVERIRITIRGVVQGVGFRPTVYRLANRLALGGWVRNSGADLEIEIEGSVEAIDRFLTYLNSERPKAAAISTEETLRIAPSGTMGFEILPSEASPLDKQPKGGAVLPDLATCEECLQEIFDPANRRFLYPFTNCTLCGPRYSILIGIPYDRPNTTMRNFELCTSCRREYDSYDDRRFHAQPIACPGCGPKLQLVAAAVSEAIDQDPLTYAAQELANGHIVGMKGIGGFQFLVDARNPTAVQRLRERKRREAKPFATLMSSIEIVRRYCEVNTEEEELLQSPAAPIVLLRPKPGHNLAPDVAPHSSYLGVMLPCSPMHHLLMSKFPYPVVATSGNLSGDPILIHNADALARLQDIADAFVLHDRPIERPCDDSVVRVRSGIDTGSTEILRRARGYAPLPIQTGYRYHPALAVGGHLKNTVAIAIGEQVILSQHIGDLDSLEARDAFQNAIDDLCRLHRFEPESIVCDLHPDYASTVWARARAKQLGIPLVQVQHHHAHVAACAAENKITGDYLGVAWDGSGLGDDGTIWGSEFFAVTEDRFGRLTHLRSFSLPGGEAATRDCSRPAASLLWETSGSKGANGLPSPSKGMKDFALLGSGVPSVRCSSMGRLFDAVAYLSGAAEHNLFEGYAAMCLENAIGSTETDQAYVIDCTNLTGDWASLVDEVVHDKRNNLDLSLISAKFHNALTNWILAVARKTRLDKVVLSGGVFQNAYLTSRTCRLLEADGFEVFTHHLVPANDGGLSLGQAAIGGRIS
jgi:hydrogenase maturation protein HypF